MSQYFCLTQRNAHQVFDKMSLKKKESSRREKMKSLEAIMKNTKRELTERAPWTAEEDQKLAEVVSVHGAENWTSSAHNDYMGRATTPGVVVNSINISDEMNSVESIMKNTETKPSRRSPWAAEEDQKLVEAIAVHGAKSWRLIAANAGLQRNGKSCRLRWVNYLRPEIKRGKMSDEEEDLIIRLHKLLGNRWSLIAGRLPGRTDNDIKNYWNSRLSKRIKQEEKQSSTGEAGDPTRQISTVDQKPSTLLPDQINVHVKMKEYSSAEALTTTTAATTSGSNKGGSDDHHDRSNSDIDVDDFFNFCNEGPFKLE